MRARLILNPRAGANRGPALLRSIVERLQRMVPALDVTVAAEEDEAVRAAERTATEGFDVLFVAGGDGTLNAALRGMRAAGGLPRGLPIGLIPLGTGNDFAKALDLGEDVDLAIDALLRADVVDVDMGLLNGRPFVNTSAGGFVAEVTATLTEELKDAAGKLSFLIGGIRALFETESFAAELAVRTNQRGSLERVTDGPLALQMFAVCNARFIGGGYSIAPEALLDDGLLDVFVVPRMSMWEFARVLQRMAAGEHMTDQRILRFRACEFELSFDRSVRTNVDGELLEARRCRYEVVPCAVRFLCGSQPQTAARPRPLTLV